MSRRGRRPRTDSILCTSSLPDFTVWKPHSQYTLCVDEDDYEQFWNITHVVHWEDFQEIYNDQSFTNYPLRTEHHCTIANSDYEGIFFGPKIPRNFHNWYGNVSFKCNIYRFLEEFSVNYYFVETVDYNTNSLSRILLSYKHYPHLRHYKPTVKGGPWYIDEDGDHLQLTDARRCDGNDSSRFGHVLEFMIELPDDQLDELYNLCNIDAVDHQDAMNGYRKCRKYRTGANWQDCPSDWSAQFVRERLEKYGINNT